MRSSFGDSCASIESRNGISSDLFLALNPVLALALFLISFEVFANCTSIELGGAYCIVVPGYTLSTTAQTTPTNVASGTDTKAVNPEVISFWCALILTKC